MSSLNQSVMLLGRRSLRYGSALTGMLILFISWSLVYALSNAVLEGVCRALFVSRAPYVLLGVGLSSLFWFYAGIMVGRFLIRLSPGHYAVATKQASYAYPPLFLVVLGGALLLVNYPMVLGDMGLGTIVVAGACDVAILGVLYIRYVNGPSVGSLSALFLRRFSSFADRSLLATCLRSIPASMTPVLLVQREEPVRNWDPFLLAWAGLKLKEPFARVPSYLESDDDDWMACIRDLARDARMVIIDVSEMSEAIRVEMDLLKTVGAVERTLVLSKTQSPAGAETVGHQVTYGMKRGVGRYVLTACLSLGSALTVWFQAQETLGISGILGRLMLGIAVVVVLTYSFVMFGKRGVAESSVDAIEVSVVSVVAEQSSK